MADKAGFVVPGTQRVAGLEEGLNDDAGVNS